MEWTSVDLKNRLSEALDSVSKGAVIRVVDRGVVKVVLVPPDHFDGLAEGIAEGWITPGEEGPIRTVTPVAARRRIARVLAEDRGE